MHHPHLRFIINFILSRTIGKVTFLNDEQRNSENVQMILTECLPAVVCSTMIVVFSIFLTRFSFSGKRNTTAFNLKKKKDDTVEFHHKNTNEHDYNDKHVRTAIGKRDNSNIDANYLSDNEIDVPIIVEQTVVDPRKKDDVDNVSTNTSRIENFSSQPNLSLIPNDSSLPITTKKLLSPQVEEISNDKSIENDGKSNDTGKSDNNSWRCACENGFLPPSLLKSFGGAEAMLRLGSGQCYHKV